MTNGGAVLALAVARSLRSSLRRSVSAATARERQRGYTAKYLAKPHIRERRKARAKERYEQKLLMLGKTRKRVGRDPEKRKASKLAWQQRNPDRVKELQRVYQATRVRRARSEAEKIEKRKADTKRRRALGMAEKITLLNAHVKAWQRYESDQRKLHDSHVKEFFRSERRAFAWRYQHDVEFRLKELIRRQIRRKIDSKDRIAGLIHAALKSGGNSPNLLGLVGWSITELRVHLQFQVGVDFDLRTLGARGFHIDHIIPKKYFNLTTLEGVRSYWALENLRLLSASENLRKGTKLEVDYVL